MLIRYISDIHSEFFSFKRDEIIPGECDVLILAGDIGIPHRSPLFEIFDWVSSNFEKTFYVMGNHEYYSDILSMEETKKSIEIALKLFPNITLLDRSAEVYKGYQFIGATLWSMVEDARYKINDVVNIPDLDIEKYNTLHFQDREYLGGELKKELPEGVRGRIVITHHLPSKKLISSEYEGSPYNQWFASSLDDLFVLEEGNIKAWFYGHTHTPLPPEGVEIDGVRFYCNPLGYPHEKRLEREGEELFDRFILLTL